MFRSTFFAMVALLTSSVALSSCIDTKAIAVSTTSQILVLGQRGVQQESSYVHAQRALPGALKTLEAFHMAYPGVRLLTGLLAEGYCQYGTGFVEDEWEHAYFIDKDFDEAQLISDRATKMYFRCMNYALEHLGSDWAQKLTGPIEELKKKGRSAGKSKRMMMVWVASGLGASINMNKDEPGLVDMAEQVEWLLRRIVVMDGDGDLIRKFADKPFKDDPVAFEAEFGKKRGVPKDKVKRALPHLALGLLFTARGTALGGNPEAGKHHFERAIELTDGKFLLAKVLYARNFGRITQGQSGPDVGQQFFHDTMVKVLQTDPAIWREQRLANEIAHRRARRYLQMEKEWF